MSSRARDASQSLPAANREALEALLTDDSIHASDVNGHRYRRKNSTFPHVGHTHSVHVPPNRFASVFSVLTSVTNSHTSPQFSQYMGHGRAGRGVLSLRTSADRFAAAFAVSLLKVPTCVLKR